MSDQYVRPLGNKNHAEVRISGFGGQGVMLAATILGRSATVGAGRNAVMAQSYGPESRGGAAMAEVIIDDDEIGYPRATALDVVVALSKDAYTKYGRTRDPGALLIAEQDLVELDAEFEKGKQVVLVPATKLAEGLKRKIVLNMVVLGALCGATGVVPPEAMKKSIADSVPPGTEKLNVEAFEAGYKYVQEHAARPEAT